MKHFINLTFMLSCAIATLACSHTTEQTGKATLTGKFSGSFPAGQTFTVKLAVPNLVLGELKQFDEYETSLEADGSFSLSIPLFSSIYATLAINEEDCGAFFLSPDKETKVELSWNGTDKMQVKTMDGQELTLDDLDKIKKLFMDFAYKVYLYPENNLSGRRFNMSPEEYKDYILKWTEQQISLTVDKAEDLPENQKQLLSKIMKWQTYIGLLFDYEGQIRSLYEKQHNEKEVNDTDFTPTKPDKSYYTFLRFFDMNNPSFNTISYVQMYKHILADRVLNIPSITNQALADWLKEVKTTMADLVGSDTGLFYDLLTLHAYLQQFEEVKPLTDNQKEEIKAYFKNPTFSQFLLAESDAAIEQSKLPSKVKETPQVEKEKLMDAIVSQYKGKVVVVDFWATWCGPCMQAMQEIKPLKEALRNKDVVFVYITETSSPLELWKKKILGIDGEHYYLSKEESRYIYNYFQINAIPTYQIYDSEGILKYKSKGFPGVEEIRKKINACI